MKIGTEPRASDKVGQSRKVGDRKSEKVEVGKSGTGNYFPEGREHPATRFYHAEPAAALEESACSSVSANMA